LTFFWNGAIIYRMRLLMALVVASCGTAPDAVTDLGISIYRGDLALSAVDVDAAFLETVSRLPTVEPEDVLEKASGLTIYARPNRAPCAEGPWCSGWTVADEIHVVAKNCIAQTSLVHEFLHFILNDLQEQASKQHDPAYFWEQGSVEATARFALCESRCGDCIASHFFVAHPE
jgi:hypothetical protein